MQISQERKDELEVNIVKLISDCLVDGSISKGDLPKIASFVLEKIDAIQDEDGLALFLSDITQKWPIFSKIQVLEKNNSATNANIQAIQDALRLANEGNNDGAVDAAKAPSEQQNINNI